MATLGDEIQVRITGDVASLKAASKDGATSLGAVETAATKAGNALAGAGAKVDAAAGQIEASLKKVETESKAAEAALETVGKGSALADPIDKAAGATKQLADGTTLASWQMANLGYQVNDVVTGLISGQRPMTVFLQQGLQMTQIFGSGATISSAMSAIGASAMSMINPLTLAVVGAGAVATAIQSIWQSWDDGSEKTKADIKAHVALIDEIKREWAGAGTAIDNYGRKSQEVLSFSAKTDRDTMKQALVSEAQAAVDAIEQMPDYAAMLASRFREVDPAIRAFVGPMEDLKASIAANNPEVERFQQQMAALGNETGASEEVRAMAAELVNATSAAASAQQRLGEASVAASVLGAQAITSAGQIAVLNAALSQMRSLAAPQLDVNARIDAAEKLGLAGASNREERDDVQMMAAAARKNQIYDNATKAIQQMDVAMQAAGKTEAEIAAANLDAWQQAQQAAKGVAGIEDKVTDATARARLAVINQAEREAQAAAQQRIALVEAQEISSIDKLKAKRAELVALQGNLSGDRATANARELAVLDQQIASTDIRLTLDAERAKIAATKAGSAERIAAQREYLDKVKAQYGAASAEAIAAERELNAAMVPRGGGAGSGSSELNNARRISQEKLKQTEYELDQEVRAGRMTEMQKLATLRDLTQASYAEMQKQLDAELARLAQGSKAWEKASQDKLLLKQQEATAMARLDDQMARESQRAAQQSARAWQSATDPMVSSFTGALRSMLTGQASFKDAMLQMVGDILLAEMEADIKAFAHHALYAALGVKEDQSAAQGGLLWMLFSQSQKTAATATGALARTSIEAGEAATAGGTKMAEVAAHVTGEATKTAATATGATMRATVEATASTATAATNAMAMKGGIFNHAASAAAATFDSVAQIPLIGYLLAPAAAAATFAAVAVFGGLLSFDVGAWNLPNDTIAKVHKGEMIVPANFSDGLRSALTGGNAGGAEGAQGNTSVHFHIQALDGASVKAFIKQHGRAIAETVAGQQNLNPSLRGNH